MGPYARRYRALFVRAVAQATALGARTAAIASAHGNLKAEGVIFQFGISPFLCLLERRTTTPPPGISGSSIGKAGFKWRGTPHTPARYEGYTIRA